MQETSLGLTWPPASVILPSRRWVRRSWLSCLYLACGLCSLSVMVCLLFLLMSLVGAPAGTQRWTSVNSTLIQRQDVESTLNRRWLNVVCLLGYVLWLCLFLDNNGYTFVISGLLSYTHSSFWKGVDSKRKAFVPIAFCRGNRQTN